MPNNKKILSQSEGNPPGNPFNEYFVSYVQRDVVDGVIIKAISAEKAMQILIEEIGDFNLLAVNQIS